MMSHGLNPGERIPFGDDLLHRQIPGAWFQAGRPCGHAFRPNERDGGEMSVYWGRLISPADAFLLHLKQNFKSAGVFSLSVAECQSVELPVHFDPVETNPSHSFVDYKGVTSKGEVKTKGMVLREYALARGMTYRPAEEVKDAEPRVPSLKPGACQGTLGLEDHQGEVSPGQEA